MSYDCPMHGELAALDHCPVCEYGWEQKDGMSLRDYFAARAITLFHLDNRDVMHDAVAKFCYSLADAMLVERARARK